MTAYPRVVCYGANGGEGQPLVKADGTPDMDVLQKFARYPVVTLDIAPWFRVAQAGRPDVLLALRRLSPRIQIGWYLLLGWTYMRYDYGPQANWTRETWLESLKATRAIRDDGFIRWEDPAVERRLTGDILTVWASKLADFFFFDYAQALSETARKAMQRTFHALRSAGCPVIIGNGPDPDITNLEGGLREGFPDHLAIATESEVQRWRSGRPEKRYDWLQSGTGLANLDTPGAQQKARYALGWACLWDMQCSVGLDHDLSVKPAYLTWWLPEYSVDANGNADASGKGVGWLGQPAGATENSAGLTVWRRLFAGGLVFVNTGNSNVNVNVPPGHRRIGGPEVGTVTVAARDAVFLVRAR